MEANKQNEPKRPLTPQEIEAREIADMHAAGERLSKLRDEKEDIEAELKVVNEKIKIVQDELSDLMVKQNEPSFTRGGKKFSLKTSRYWSAKNTEDHDALYAALKEHGHEGLFTVNFMTLKKFLKDAAQRYTEKLTERQALGIFGDFDESEELDELGEDGLQGAEQPRQPEQGEVQDGQEAAEEEKPEIPEQVPVWLRDHVKFYETFSVQVTKGSQIKKEDGRN